MSVLENLQPQLVFKYFEEISQIPRGSGNERGISDYLVSFAKGLGLEVIQDEVLNIIIKKPASKGYESAPTVILQGHMDMVCEKNKDTEHDFTKDPLKLRIDGDFIYATGTTLGADDGIAVAYAMAILADDTIEHPAIEVLLTIDEETGMTGAMNLNPADLDGKIILNLDSETEGELLVSCAGGVRTKSAFKMNFEETLENHVGIEVIINGLLGGHSGMEINKQRANSNKLMGRVLRGLFEKFDIRLSNVYGGSKDNAIPREAEAMMTVNKAMLADLKNEIANFEKMFKHEFNVQDKNIKISVNEGIEIKETFDKKSTETVISALYLYPNGINTMSMAMEGLVESSTNVGVVTTTDGVVSFDSAVRSSVSTLREEIVLRSKTLTEMLGGGFETHAEYPAWEYKSESPIRNICVDVYKEMYGKAPEVVAIHAGVECGLFEEKLGDLDMVSFGPSVYDAHSPQEHASIKSIQNVWEYLLKVLKEIK
ncbi:MAG: aminoacyl-histidine dipeptidase [Clostridium sp.]|uniref:aminoacyl-histidine dipeptidase n=1 Tax=Clostridium sp. TaxID=1506 RepID=UPI003F3CDCA1